MFSLSDPIMQVTEHDDDSLPELSLDDIAILEVDDDDIEDVEDMPTTLYRAEPNPAELRGVQVRLHIDGRVIIGFTTDLTEKGVFVVCPNPPAVGELIEVEIFLSAQKSFHVDGVVRRHGTGRELGQRGCGVSFKSAPPAVKMRINALVRALGLPTR